jgi:hypothetical membrane protein
MLNPIPLASAFFQPSSSKSLGMAYFLKTPSVSPVVVDGPSLKRAGALLLVGTVQFLFCFILAEIYYPGYDVSSNRISDLGATCNGGVCKFVQPSSAIFNSSIVLLGVSAFLGSYFLWKGYGSKALPLFIALSGIGAAGVGVFNESYGSIHALFSALAFVAGGTQAILVSRVARAPVSYFSAAAGIIALTAFLLYASSAYLGLGAGGMERMIAYPTLFASVGFGGYLLGVSTTDLL